MNGDEESPNDLRIRKRQIPPYWWPDTQSVMQLFLAFAIVFMVAFILRELLSNSLKIDTSVKDLVIFMLGIIFGNFKDVYGFTYGASIGEKNKGEIINRSLENKDKIIAEGVAATAAVAANSPAAAATAAAEAAPAAAALAAPAAAAVAAPPAAAVAAPPVVDAVVPPAVEKEVARAIEAHAEMEKQKEEKPK